MCLLTSNEAHRLASPPAVQPFTHRLPTYCHMRHADLEHVIVNFLTVIHDLTPIGRYSISPWATQTAKTTRQKRTILTHRFICARPPFLFFPHITPKEHFVSSFHHDLACPLHERRSAQALQRGPVKRSPIRIRHGSKLAGSASSQRFGPDDLCLRTLPLGPHPPLTPDRYGPPRGLRWYGAGVSKC
ncbi:hypothetical protein BS50DRAFT_61576 [Corynespora cassiicola Philippines]|uniref:Uncharacterized protein n=1 Tax=Corynespora cassiicola Philippines TaxID=1448308 RepID=A0A2T2NJY0_CORCC|nr:hypothetical protein BS50DRAFT_61576 [Corynespora cassiicola Philippines]